MRNIYEQSTNESHAMLAEAAERFTDVVQGLKSMATEMQQELEATRGELRKGILELPAETAESAAQMRRVIVDQIEALAELNRIVARHGRGLDAVEPTVAPRRGETAEMSRRVLREEPVMTNGNGNGRPPEPPMTRPRPDLGGMGARSEMPNMAPPPAGPARRGEAPSLSPGGAQGGAQGPGGGRSGWLSDLLTRASRDDAELPPQREAPRGSAGEPRGSSGIDSLDSLAVDIARMIDHDVAADLWERYKRGERNVFTRKLYTMQGQQAFEEIRRKYRGDRDFMRTVDRYIAEFERLLEEVSRDDRGQVVARTYLTSETGKVYTMLAHAAGRFD
jgi:hypothetical protein